MTDELTRRDALKGAAALAALAPLAPLGAFPADAGPKGEGDLRGDLPRSCQAGVRVPRVRGGGAGPQQAVAPVRYTGRRMSGGASGTGRTAHER